MEGWTSLWIIAWYIACATDFLWMDDLTRLSIENGNAPVAVPDFTRGNWNKVDGYHHAFAQ